MSFIISMIAGYIVLIESFMNWMFKKENMIFITEK